MPYVDFDLFPQALIFNFRIISAQTFDYGLGRHVKEKETDLYDSHAKVI